MPFDAGSGHFDGLSGKAFKALVIAALQVSFFSLLGLGPPKFDTLELISLNDFNGDKHLGGFLRVCGSGTLHAGVCWHYTA